MPGGPAVAAAVGRLDTTVGSLAATWVVEPSCPGEGDPCLDTDLYYLSSYKHDVIKLLSSTSQVIQ